MDEPDRIQAQPGRPDTGLQFLQLRDHQLNLLVADRAIHLLQVAQPRRLVCQPFACRAARRCHQRRRPRVRKLLRALDEPRQQNVAHLGPREQRPPGGRWGWARNQQAALMVSATS